MKIFIYPKIVSIKMRHNLTKEFKETIQTNKKKILEHNPDLKWTLKNLLKKNQTIDEKNLNKICNILNLNRKKLNLRIVNFHKERNFGKYSIPREINFKGINKDFAEYIGIMLGDGNLYRDLVRIMIDNREQEFKKHIQKISLALFGIKFNEYVAKGSNQLCLYKCNKNLINLLIKYGLKKGNKSKNQVRIPSWIKEDKGYSAACLRGLFDTDGCVYKCKREGKTYIKFTNVSQPLLKDVSLLAKKLSINFSKAGKHSICLYKDEEIVKYLKEIGFSNTKHLNKIKGL